METGPLHTMTFEGPYSWLDAPGAPSIFKSIAPGTKGVYLWTVERPDGHLVFYVGESGRCVSNRMAEHYFKHATGQYSLYEPSAFARGEKRKIWARSYGKDKRTLGECVEASVALAPQILELSRLLRFFVAPMTYEDRIRRRMEAALADELAKAPGEIGAFQDEGVWYQRRREMEAPIDVVVGSSSSILGLPTELMA